MKNWAFNAILLTLLPLLMRQEASAQPTVVQSTTTTSGSANDRLEDLKHKADDAYRARDFDTAVRLSSQVLSEQPNDSVALYLRGSARVELGITQGDADVVRAGVEDARNAIRYDTSKKSDYYLPYLYGMGQLSALEGNPSHAETAVTVATQVLSRDNLESAMRANLLFQRGRARLTLDKQKDAIDDFRRSIEISPIHLGSRMALSEALQRAGQFDKAEETLDGAVEAFPSSPLVFNNRGMFHQSRGQMDKAILDFTQAISLNPQFTQAHLNRGFTLLRKGDAEAALGDLNAVLEAEPNNATAVSLRGTANLRMGNLEAAKESYRRAVEMAPNNPAARADLGFAYFFTGEYATAAAAFDQSLALQPQNEFLHPWKYVALTRSGQSEAAEAAFASLREKEPENLSWFDAITLLLMGDLEEDALLSRLESRDRQLRDAQVCEAYYFIGVTKQTGDPEKANAYFRRAVRSEAKQLSAYQAAQIALGDSQGRQ